MNEFTYVAIFRQAVEGYDTEALVDLIDDPETPHELAAAMIGIVYSRHGGEDGWLADAVEALPDDLSCGECITAALAARR